MPQIPATFSCPHCRAPLRLRQRPAGDLYLPCPDCKQPLELSDQAGELLVRPDRRTAPATAVRPAAAGGTAVAAASARFGRNFGGATSRILADPLVVTWLAAGAATLLLGIAFIRSGGESTTLVANEPRIGDEKVAGDEVPTVPPDEAARPDLSAAAETAVVNLPEPTAPPDTVMIPEPVVAPRPTASPPVDPREEIVARLAQRVLSFEQSTPVSFDTLRIQIEELSGVPIRYGDGTADDPRFRSAPVRLALSDVSLAAVLGEAARQAGLEEAVDGDGVRLVPADPARQAETNPTASAAP